MSDIRTALVLGASGYFGRAIAHRLSADGYRLGLHAFQHPDRLPNLPEARSYTADLCVPDQLQALAAAYLKEAGRLDVLVWAAGTTHEAPVASLSEEDLRAVLQTDLTAPFMVAKTFSRQFLKQKAGSVVFLSSHAGLRGRAGGAAYAMAQSGLLSLMRSMAREWGPLGVRVNAVVPPFAPESGFGAKSSPEFVASVTKQNVFTSTVAPDGAVAEIVSRLASDQSTSGQVVVADARVSV